MLNRFGIHEGPYFVDGVSGEKQKGTVLLPVDFWSGNQVQKDNDCHNPEGAPNSTGGQFCSKPDAPTTTAEAETATSSGGTSNPLAWGGDEKKLKTTLKIGNLLGIKFSAAIQQFTNPPTNSLNLKNYDSLFPGLKEALPTFQSLKTALGVSVDSGINIELDGPSQKFRVSLAPEIDSQSAADVVVDGWKIFSEEGGRKQLEEKLSDVFNAAVANRLGYVSTVELPPTDNYLVKGERATAANQVRPLLVLAAGVGAKDTDVEVGDRRVSSSSEVIKNVLALRDVIPEDLRKSFGLSVLGGGDYGQDTKVTVATEVPGLYLQVGNTTSSVISLQVGNTVLESGPSGVEATNTPFPREVSEKILPKMEALYKSVLEAPEKSKLVDPQPDLGNRLGEIATNLHNQLRYALMDNNPKGAAVMAVVDDTLPPPINPDVKAAVDNLTNEQREWLKSGTGADIYGGAKKGVFISYPSLLDDNGGVVEVGLNFPQKEFTATLSKVANDMVKEERDKILAEEETRKKVLAERQAAAAAIPLSSLNQEVIDVGGDEWNRNEAVSLERQYQSVKPTLDELSASLKDKEFTAEVEGSGPPDSWDQVSEDDQSKVANSWYEDNLSSEVDQQVEYWKEKDGDWSEADRDIAPDILDDSDWLSTTLEDMEMSDEKPLPVTLDSLANAMVLSFDGDYKGDGLTVEWNDSALEPVVPESKDQEEFPFAEEYKRSSWLSDSQKEEIELYVREEFEKELEKRVDSADPPSWVEEQAQESLKDSWDNTDDEYKLQYAIKNNLVGDSESTYEKSFFGAPDTFVSNGKNGDEDFEHSKAFAKALLSARLEQIYKERGLDPDRAVYDNQDMWDEWKGSSSSSLGKAMQLAAYQEFGARFSSHIGSPEEVETNFRNTYQNMSLDRVRASLRADWEVSNYLLDKSGDQLLSLYRGMELKEEGVSEAEHGTPLKTTHYNRSGAQSMTFSAKVANEWRDGYSHEVVLRAKIPRTSVMSLPLFGKTIKEESEVVVMGGAWKSWDLWRGNAPTFASVALKMLGLGGNS